MQKRCFGSNAIYMQQTPIVKIRMERLKPGVGMMPTLTSLLAPRVVMKSTCVTTDDDTVSIVAKSQFSVEMI